MDKKLARKIVGSWDGSSEKFVFEDQIMTEDHVLEAEALLNNE
jgi:hypothetical protein